MYVSAYINGETTHASSAARTGSWTGPPRGERASRVGISSTVFQALIFRGWPVQDPDLTAGIQNVSKKIGTCKTVKARFWPWLSGECPHNASRCFLFARKWYGSGQEHGFSAPKPRRGPFSLQS